MPKCALSQSSAIAILSNVAVVSGGFSADKAEDVSKHFTMISIANGMSDTELRSQNHLIDSQALDQGTTESKVLLQFNYSLQQSCTYVQPRPLLLHDAVLKVP